MYSIISNPRYLDAITMALKDNAVVLYRDIGTDIDIISSIEKANRVRTKVLIIDVTCVEDIRKLPQAIRRYRIKNDTVRIIILAPDCSPGNELISMLVTMGVYDIVSFPSGDAENVDIAEMLQLHIENPATYSKAVKWDNSANELSTVSPHETDRAKEQRSDKSPDRSRTVTIEKDKIIGTVVIAVTGTMKRAGTSHVALTIAGFLRRMKFKVAVLELHKSNHFGHIKEAYDGTDANDSLFKFNEIDFYPYSEELDILDVLQCDYNYMILDMGVYNGCDVTEFKRANERIIVSGSNEWELPELEVILKNMDRPEKNKYIFSFCDLQAFRFIKNNMAGLPCYMFPFNPQPLQKNKEAHDALLSILNGVLPSMTKKFSLNNIIPSLGVKKGVTNESPEA